MVTQAMFEWSAPDPFRGLREGVQVAEVGGKKQPVVDGSRIHEFLREDNKKVGKSYRHWIAGAIKRQQLKEGEDFILIVSAAYNQKKQGGDRKSRVYLFTQTAAERIIGSDPSPAGRKFLSALVDLLHRVEKGDVQVVEYAVGRMKDPEDVARVLNAGEAHAWRLWHRQGKTWEWFQDWLAKRRQGKLSRAVLTETLASHDVRGIGYARCTDATYRATFDKTAKQLREELGVSGGRTPRDAMEPIDVVRLDHAEHLAAAGINRTNARGNVKCAFECGEAARHLREAERRYEREAGLRAN